MAVKTEIKGQQPKYVGQSDYIYVPMIVFNQTVKSFFKKPINISTQLMSNNGFRTENEALSFIPLFIAEKIKTGDLPKEMVQEDETGRKYINEAICQPGYLKVKLSILELEDEN